MIDSHGVKQLEDARKPPHPPGKTGLFMFWPGILRMTPMLSVPVESIRRIAGHTPWLAAPVELEKLWMAPNVRAVVRDEDGQVADQTDAAAMGVLAQRPPLAVKLELHETVAGDLVDELFAR